MFRTTFLATAVALAMLPAAASAQDAATLFTRRADYVDARLSPTGEYVSVNTPYGDHRALTLIKLSGNYDRSVIRFDAPETVGGSWWTDVNRIMVAKGKDYGFLGGISNTNNLYTANADASEQEQIFGYLPDHSNFRSKLKDQGSVSVMDVLHDSKGDVLLRFVPYVEGNSKWVTSVFKVNTHTGKREQLDSIPDWAALEADNTGKPRFAVTWDLDGEQIVKYRRLPTSDWEPAPELLRGSEMNVYFFEADNNHAIMEISDKGEPATLYRVDLAAGTREKLAGHPAMEVRSVMRGGFQGPPVVVRYDAGKPKVDYLDPTSEWAKLHAGLMKAFPGQLVQFLDITRDSNKVLFYVFSDRHPGAYYLFDRSTGKPQMLFETMEWIDPAKMSPMMPIEFKNRQGETLFGFYTAPQGKPGPHPMVVIPHGGPFGPYDSWGFDADTQYLASLGYAVLQVNFRGSGGRGEGFMTSTYRQWGTGIQDDIADGVKFAIQQNLAKPDKVCIYGISFGGYSAMMNPILNPGMYKCSIGYAGVYDLGAMIKADDGSKQSRANLAREVGTDPALIAAQSPARRAKEMPVPMLLIHGKADWIAPYEQYEIAEAALRFAGKPYESLVKPNEGHGFYKDANRVEAYRKMAAFLAKYNPVE
jgi:dipeptidyl aminopeptidase/acylaminoacyl peptidase